MERYIRQIPLIGEDGQKKLSDSSVFIAGVGGLGTPVLLYLVAAGVGHIKIADDDRVSLSNLNRQILYNEYDIGLSKVLLARDAIFNSSIKITTEFDTITEDNIGDYIGSCDVAIDCLDNFHARLIVNRECVKKRIPLVEVAIEGFTFSIKTIIPGNTACLNCYAGNFKDNDNVIPSIGAACGIAGSFAALEVIKVLTRIGKPRRDLTFINTLEMTSIKIPISRQKDCEVCKDV